VRDRVTKRYSWLLFDADGTLFDYDRAESLALTETFQAFEVPFEGQYLDTYRRINQELWRALERREISSSALPVRRFELLAHTLNLACSPDRMSSVYLERLALAVDLIDDAQDLLRTLHSTCRMAIVTNGFESVQRSRLANSVIRDYITELIISEEVGAAKPKPAFFAAAFARLGDPDKSEVLLIGDSLTADMQGGADYGVDTCWYNPSGEIRPDDLQITYEITRLRDLLEVLD